MRCDECGEKECCGAVMGVEIADLKAEVERLRDALQEIADTLEPYSFQTDLDDDEARATAGDWNRIRPIALEALGEGE